MEHKLRLAIEARFDKAADDPQAAELMEEIIRNTIEKYHDLLAQGRTEQEAYDLALEGVGDLDELLSEFGAYEDKEPFIDSDELENIRSRAMVFRSIAIALYILCCAPVIALSSTLPLLGASMIFYFVGTATGLLIYESMTRKAMLASGHVSEELRRKAVFRAVGVGMYISCVTPCILLAATQVVALGPALMFVMIAAATVLVILSRTPKLTAAPISREVMLPAAPKPRRSALYCVLVAVIWTAAAVFFILTPLIFGFQAYSATWLVFPLAVCLQNLMRAVFDYNSEVIA